MDYHLPKELIAQTPLEKRDHSNLLVLDRKTGHIEHKKFYNVVEYLQEGDVLVLNSTKVLPARLIATRKTGGKVEVLFVKRVSEREMYCLLDTPRHLLTGEVLYLEESIKIVLKQKRGYDWLCETSEPVDLVLKKVGRSALPPYIKRGQGPTPDDLRRYQTVYAETEGSIAAPTAGLHFTNELLCRIGEAGADIVKIILHVGLGTFKPVRSEMVEEHMMEEEYFEISDEALEKIEKGKRIVAVGTTSVRALETYAMEKKQKGETGLFIKPGTKVQIVNAMITNFHLPRTTLLALVYAFAGKDLTTKAYQEAIERRYRFYSYGDAMLIT